MKCWIIAIFVINFITISIKFLFISCLLITRECEKLCIYECNRDKYILSNILY